MNSLPCPQCGSSHGKKNGHTHYGKQNYQCLHCGHQFVEDSQAMREVEPDDLNEEFLEEFLSTMDGVFNVINRIDKRRRERHKLLAKANG